MLVLCCGVLCCAMLCCVCCVVLCCAVWCCVVLCCVFDEDLTMIYGSSSEGGLTRLRTAGHS